MSGRRVNYKINTGIAVRAAAKTAISSVKQCVSACSLERHRHQQHMTMSVDRQRSFPISAHCRVNIHPPQTLVWSQTGLKDKHKGWKKSTIGNAVLSESHIFPITEWTSAPCVHRGHCSTSAGRRRGADSQNQTRLPGLHLLTQLPPISVLNSTVTQRQSETHTHVK